MLDGYDRLRFEIVAQAVEDYKENKTNGDDNTELEMFFRSRWCDCLLQGLTVTGRDILERLER